MIPLHDDNPTEIRPYVTVGLIVACTVVFLAQLAAGRAMRGLVYAFGVVPAVLFGTRHLPPVLDLIPPALTVISSQFLHGGWLHLIGNMLFLWIFGNNVEDAMGHGRFLVFYLLCGALAALAQAAMDPASMVPMIGASGAISGVLGAYLLLYPHARVLVGIPFGFYLHTLWLKAGWVLGLWLGYQLLSSVLAGRGGGGGVAFFAHVGGFIAGLLLVAVFKRRGVRLLNPARPYGRRG